jgi:hypothetical protein
MYANELIEINGLTFGTTTRVDDIYMEAITINLKDITFPANSDVFFRSRDGTIDFDTFNNPTVGAVNFTNVIHPDVKNSALSATDFNSNNGVLETINKAVRVGGQNSSVRVGAANFTNVVHPDVSSSALTSSDFTQQSNGQYQTTHNAITVRQL